MIFGAVVFPALMVFGALGALRKHQREREELARSWRDDSLAEWYRERDARAAAEREQRLRSEQPLHAGREEEEASETSHQQRVGG